MVATFLSLILATATADPVIPTLNPYLEISLPDQGQDPREFRGPIPVVPTHIFIEDSTETLIVLYRPDGLSLYDLPSGKLRQTYALARPHPFQKPNAYLTLNHDPRNSFLPLASFGKTIKSSSPNL
jgi:hypothetical protein